MGITWKSGFQGEACIKCMSMQRKEHDSQWEGHQLAFQAMMNRFGTKRCLISQQAANQCWIGSAAKGGHWLNAKPFATQGMLVNPSGSHGEFSK